MRLGVLALFPNSGSVTRPSLPSAGSSRDEFPDFHGTMEDSDSCCPVSPDSCARLVIPSLRRLLRSAVARHRHGGQEFSGSATPRTDEKDEGERQVSPVAGEPWWAFAVFLDPGRTPRPGRLRLRDAAPPLVQTVGSLREA